MRWLLVLLMVATAHADDGMTGFTTFGSGPMHGRVTTADGKGVAGARVHVVSSRGEQVVAADQDGNYRVDLAGQTLIYVDGRVRLGGEVAETVKLGKDGEAIEVHATLPPKKLAVPKSDPTKIPEYSEAAADRNVWVRAWVMLDVDAAGAVRRVKFLKRPGYDLDEIALRTARALRFSPARDAADKPIPTIMVWPLEWPSASWLRGHYGRMKPDAVLPQCRREDQDPLTETRDCSGPDLSRAFVERWY